MPANPTTETGPSATDVPLPTTSSHSNAESSSDPSAPSLTFRFAPQMGSLVNPPIDSLPFGTDAWAVHHAKASVTPLRTNFAEPGAEGLMFGDEKIIESDLNRNENQGKPGRVWKWKL